MKVLQNRKRVEDYIAENFEVRLMSHQGDHSLLGNFKHFHQSLSSSEKETFFFDKIFISFCDPTDETGTVLY